MGFIAKYILPREEDFLGALSEQTGVTRRIVHDLHDACLEPRAEAFEAIRRDADRARSLRSANTKRLLNVFITPWDRESIYRLVTQLDWVVLSVKHLVIEREAYAITSLADYRDILVLLKDMASLLETSFRQLASREMDTLAATMDQIHDQYDRVVEDCARATAVLLETDDCRSIIRHEKIVAQLKEIAKRMHVSANALEDMAIKVV
jgi:uncharacterized protein Yka (UPF0111/DUF47 family)